MLSIEPDGVELLQQIGVQFSEGLVPLGTIKDLPETPQLLVISKIYTELLTGSLSYTERF